MCPECGAKLVHCSDGQLDCNACKKTIWEPRYAPDVSGVVAEMDRAIDELRAGRMEMLALQLSNWKRRLEGGER